MLFSAFNRKAPLRGAKNGTRIVHVSPYQQQESQQGFTAYRCTIRFCNRTMSLAMKLTAYLMLIACLQVSARGTAQRISFSKKNVPLKEVFAAIKQQTGYTVFCNYKILEKARNVDVHVTKAALQDVLNEVLKEQGLDYVIEEKMIVIFDKSIGREASFDPNAFMPPPVTTINGKVLDEDGAALEGAYFF